MKDPEGQLRVVTQLPWLGESDQENALKEVRLLSSMKHPCIVLWKEDGKMGEMSWEWLERWDGLGTEKIES